MTFILFIVPTHVQHKKWVKLAQAVQQVHHTRPIWLLYTGPAHHDMVMAGYVQVAWAEESSLAVLVLAVAIEEVGLRDKWPQHRKWWESGIHIQISTEIFAALQQPLLPLAIVQVGLGVVSVLAVAIEIKEVTAHGSCLSIWKIKYTNQEF